MSFHLFLRSALLATVIAGVYGFVPASPNNQSLSKDARDVLRINWQPEGIFTDSVARIAIGSNSSDVDIKGALLHFVESNSTASQSTSIPWVAFIHCDSNATDAGSSNLIDLAQSNGAEAALLYSLYSETCALSSTYVSQLDVYVTISKQESLLVEAQFVNVDKDKFYFFNPSVLDAAGSPNGTLPYLYSTLRSSSTSPEGSTTATTSEASASPSSSSPSLGSNGASLSQVNVRYFMSMGLLVLAWIHM